MIIHDRSAEKKFINRLRIIRFALKFARLVGGRPAAHLLNRTCYFGGGTKNRLEVIAPYQKSMLMHLDIHSYVERRILCTGHFEPWITDIITRSLKPGNVAIDVGANSGCHTLMMANAVGMSGKVLAFEPNPRMFSRLKANLRLNRFDHVEAFPVALSREQGRLNLFIPAEADFNQGRGSIHRDNLDAGCEEVSVDVKTLDSMVEEQKLQRIDLIKVDVEGHELPVFLGARQALKKFKPILIFEFIEKQWRSGGFAPADMEGLLVELGYELYVMRKEMTMSIKYGAGDTCDILALPK